VPSPLRDLPATSAERKAAGTAARRRVSRDLLGHWAEADRGHDALQTILAQNQIRVPGFDLRDFDETLPGPFEWDIKRFAASLVVAARENRIKPAKADAAVAAGVEAYRKRMRSYTGMHELDIWYDGMHVDSLLRYFEPADRGRVSVHIERKRRRRTSRGAFAKLTTMAHGRPRITEEPPLRTTISDDEQADLVDHLLAEYRLTLQEDRRHLFDRFTEVDVVRQVVGSAASGWLSTWYCWRAAPGRTRCSCKSSRPGRRCMRLIRSPAATTTMARG
jgi:Uncharacterized protein conserved in bacteria (DUF2252)